MKTHALIIHLHEVLAALRGELGLVVRPISLRQVHDIDDAGDPMRECRDGIWRKAPCPLGVPGDRLCCKETWGGDDICGQAYKADHPEWTQFMGDGEQPNSPWRSPATMPPWASRITLEVVSVRVCRIQEITEDEAEAMCFYRQEPECYHTNCDDRYWATGAFAAYWSSRYGRRYPWESSWVWAAKVKRVEG